MKKDNFDLSAFDHGNIEMYFSENEKIWNTKLSLRNGDVLEFSFKREENDFSDFWYGFEYKGNQYDLNIYNSEESDNVAAVYPVIDGETDAETFSKLDAVNIYTRKRTEESQEKTKLQNNVDSIALDENLKFMGTSYNGRYVNIKKKNGLSEELPMYESSLNTALSPYLDEDSEIGKTARYVDKSVYCYVPREVLEKDDKKVVQWCRENGIDLPEDIELSQYRYDWEIKYEKADEEKAVSFINDNAFNKDIALKCFALMEERKKNLVYDELGNFYLKDEDLKHRTGRENADLELLAPSGLVDYFREITEDLIVERNRNNIFVSPDFKSLLSRLEDIEDELVKREEVQESEERSESFAKNTSLYTFDWSGFSEDDYYYLKHCIETGEPDSKGVHGHIAVGDISIEIANNNQSENYKENGNDKVECNFYVVGKSEYRYGLKENKSGDYPYWCYYNDVDVRMFTGTYQSFKQQMEKDWTFIINTDKDLVIAAKRPTLKDWNGPEANLEAVKLYCLDSYKKENPFDPKLSVFEGDLDFFMKYQREIDNFEYLDKMLRKKIDYKQETKPGVVGFKDMPKVMYNKFKDEYLGKYMPLEIKYRINVPEIFCDYLANKNEPDNASVKNILPAIEERIKDVFKTTSHVENEKTIIEEDKTIFEITMTHDFACTDKTDSLNFPYGTIEDKLQRPLGIALNNLIPANVKSKNPTEMITFDSITPVPDHTRMENDLKLRLNNELKKGLNLPHQVLTDVILSIPAKNAKIVNEILKKKGLLQKEAIDRYFNSDDITKLKKKSSGRNIGR